MAPTTLTRPDPTCCLTCKPGPAFGYALPHRRADTRHLGRGLSNTYRFNLARMISDRRVVRTHAPEWLKPAVAAYAVSAEKDATFSSCPVKVRRLPVGFDKFTSTVPWMPQRCCLAAEGSSLIAAKSQDDACLWPNRDRERRLRGRMLTYGDDECEYEAGDIRCSECVPVTTNNNVFTVEATADHILGFNLHIDGVGGTWDNLFALTKLASDGPWTANNVAEGMLLGYGS